MITGLSLGLKVSLKSSLYTLSLLPLPCLKKTKGLKGLRANASCSSLFFLASQSHAKPCSSFFFLLVKSVDDLAFSARGFLAPVGKVGERQCLTKRAFLINVLVMIIKMKTV